MTFKNILFVISFTLALPCHSFSGLDFMRKQPQAKKNAYCKVITGIFLIAPSRVVLGDSQLADTISAAGWLGGLAIGITGGAQIAAEYFGDEEIKQYTNVPGYDAAINKLCRDKRFLIGAALGTGGFLIHAFAEGAQTPDAAKYAALLGLALMGEKIGEQLITDYLPYIVSLFTK